ncbi:GTP cyclohydrolase II [Bacillus sp. NPDC077027]|uniref:GTP cyclohydrolase II n=1 Tax=Bacillus sp. NPDC077027 TaxID=3390548 RepID=UPI003D022C3A
MDKRSKNKTAILKDKIKRVKHEDSYLYITGPIRLPVNLDGRTVTFNWYSWLKDDGQEALSDEELISSLSSRDLADHQQSSVLVYGDFQHADEALIRMHSICHTGDIFGSKRCDCGFQLKQSMKMIEENGAGALFYLANHEGRGIGLFSKAMAYILQENGYDTVEANEALGFDDDTRNYGEAIAVLQTLRTKPVRLITNNPKKTDAISDAGLSLSGRVPLWGDVSEFNEKYLQTKISRSGHMKADQEVHTIATS